ncbi:MAG: glycosyltransferase [Planctomycetota bacterium]|nr:MAG: glycosyltransferase [Planctomycetota bacterium]
MIRRATLADLNGSWFGDHEGCGPLIQEAARQGRAMAISPRPVLDAALTMEERISGIIRRVAPPPSSVHQYRPQQITSAPVPCDVVLPFKGQLDYVREALDSLLNQQFVQPIIHLIDDTTESDTTDFLNEWARHPQLRVYRNRENVGQFQSFNNVAPYWETDLVAVQDADDISLPHRLHWAIQMLQASGADYFGGAVELFGDEDLIRPVMSETTELARMRRADYRRSFYPLWSKTDYFLENPTAVFRTAMFREMGGYADFGSRLMNRTSLDTEFQLRCLYRGVRFAITREIVTRYRVHPESATQNRQTGWGTTPRAASIRQLEERCRIFRSGNFDPRLFGALGRYTHLTERWNG